MSIADSKKCQTLINLCALDCQRLQAIYARLVAYRLAYINQNVNSTGTPLEGHLSEISQWIDDIGDVANNPIACGLITVSISSHRNQALGEVE